MTIFLKYLQYLHIMENDKHILIQVSTLLTPQMLHFISNSNVAFFKSQK